MDRIYILTYESNAEQFEPEVFKTIEGAKERARVLASYPGNEEDHPPLDFEVVSDPGHEGDDDVLEAVAGELEFTIRPTDLQE